MMNDYKELIGQLNGACIVKVVMKDMQKADLFSKAADAIEQLVNERDYERETADDWQHRYFELATKCSQIKKERDAAICEIPHICQTCYGNNMEADCVDNPCWNCKGNNNPEWEWRGVKEEVEKALKKRKGGDE